MTPLQETDKKNIWHPYTQMKTFNNPIPIVEGRGAYLFDELGNRYIDAISSWWVNTHGHCNPYIAEKIATQAKKLEHSLFAGLTHQPAVELSEKLLNILPDNQKKIFFSDNGSTSVEIAIKMAIQYFRNQGAPRSRIIAFEDAFHGETFGTMSVGGKSVYNEHFRDFLFDVDRIPLPTPGKEQEVLAALETLLEQDEYCCFIFEPLVLGAAGMLMYSPEILNALIGKCREKGVLTIADEVMTGFGRTGKNFAVDYVQNKPDLMCMSKGLTGGFLPMAITSCSQHVFDNFLADDNSKTFFHGHSFTANPLGCAASIASIDLLNSSDCKAQLLGIESSHKQFAKRLKEHPKVENVRVTGTILAFDVVAQSKSETYGALREQLYAFYMKHNLLLRPLGSTVYVLPPFCIEPEDLDTIYTTLLASLEHVSIDQ